MKFVISKALLLISLPLSSLLFVMGCGFLLAKRFPRYGKWLSSFAFLTIYLLSISPVSNLLLRPLEREFKPFGEDVHKHADYIVVLGGGVVDLSWLGDDMDPSGTSLQRLVEGIRLQRKMVGAKLVLSGGSGDPSRPNLNEAEAMRKVALSLGVPSEDILLEGKSRNTLESVLALKEELLGKRVVLVTSAFHMERSEAMFRKAGIEVFPAPTNYGSEDVSFSFFSLIPDVGSLSKSSTAFYEYLARFWYSLNGAI